MIIINMKKHMIINKIFVISLFPNTKANIVIIVLVKKSTNLVLFRNIFFISK